MPDINGIEATRRIHRDSPHIVIRLKDADQTDLLRAIHTVANGGVIFSPEIAGRVVQ